MGISCTRPSERRTEKVFRKIAGRIVRGTRDTTLAQFIGNLRVKLSNSLLESLGNSSMSVS